MLVDGDRQVARLLMLPGRQRAHERRRLGDDRVAVVEGDAADQVQALHRAGQDDHVLGADVNAAPGQALGDDLAQRRQVPGSGRTAGRLGRLRRIAREYARFERLERVRLGGRLPAAEADQVGADAERGRVGQRDRRPTDPVGQPGRSSGATAGVARAIARFYDRVEVTR